MRKTPLLSGLGALAVTPAFLMAMATPASAMASISVTASCGYIQTCHAYAQDVPGVGTGADVTVSCTAVTPYTVQATVVQCFIRGNNLSEPPHYTPTKLTQGQTSTLNHTFPSWMLESRSYDICVGAGYFDNSGNYHPPTNFACGLTV